MEFNKYQTSLEDLHLEEYPEEVQEQFADYIATVPFIQALIKKDRPRAKDLPKDEEGKIVFDITNPHILENMDYFRPTAIHYQKHGVLTKLRPNPNPNSEYGKWAKEEVRRCREGYIRESDGEWIPGDMYFFLNYCPILLSKKDGRSKKASRVIDFPKVWEGHYYKFHYLNKAREEGKHAMELSRRGSGKSYTGGAMLAKRFYLGESAEVCKRVQCVVTASEKKYLSGANQILDMFNSYIDFCAQNTQWPSMRLISTIQNLQWVMGYTDQDTGTKKGTLNSVVGITSKDDESKLRGSRGVLYLIEEAGSFPRLLNLYNVLRPSVEDGNAVFGQIFCYGTAGDSQSDFQAMQEMMYNPKGYNILGISNIFDKAGQGRDIFTYFFPGYLNRSECYDENGNSDVTKALLEILHDRYIVKYNSTDLNSITKRIAEIPITPQEAVLKTQGNIFPVTQLTEQLSQLDNNPNSFDDVYVGDLVLGSSGQITFKYTNDTPIRDFPLKTNTDKGALEVYAMPQVDAQGNIPHSRYIAGFDPYNNDQAESNSLGSVFVLDLFTDRIVAEYTGRTNYAEELYELVRKLCLFYNCRCLYESNIKGCFAYFSKMNSLHLLADTPEYLRDKQLIKYSSWGNNSKGVNASHAINNYANQLIKDWLTQPVTAIKKQEDGTEIEVTIQNLFHIKNRALLRELICYNPIINVDRIRALGMVMLYRQEKMILYNGDVEANSRGYQTPGLENDNFFVKNYDQKFNVPYQL